MSVVLAFVNQALTPPFYLAESASTAATGTSLLQTKTTPTYLPQPRLVTLHSDMTDLEQVTVRSQAMLTSKPIEFLLTAQDRQ